MSQGLQVWDDSGNLVFSDEFFAIRILGSITTGVSNGSIYIPELAEDPSPAFVFSTEAPANLSVFTITPDVSVSGATISWVFNASSTGIFKRVSMKVYYGVSA